MENIKNPKEEWEKIKSNKKTRELIEGARLIGAFLTLPSGIWEFTINKEGKDFNVKLFGEEVIVQPTSYMKKEKIEEIDLDNVGEMNKILGIINKEVSSLCKGEDISRTFLFIRKGKEKEEIVATITTTKMSVVTLTIDAETCKIKSSKTTNIFSQLTGLKR